ncbi:MAG: ribonuclease III [Patescibacteria group bacterium]
MNDYRNLEEQIGIQIKNKQILENAFVHRSYLNENKDFYLPSNEKMEFLGDSVLSLITSMYLYKYYPDLAEGEYTDIKAAIVRTESLGEAAQDLNLGSLLYLSHGEEKGQGRTNINLLADTFEALVAAIFIDIGFESAYHFVLKHLFKDRLDEIIKSKSYMSPKSHLQEIVQSIHKTLPVYRVVGEEGPEHKKTFKVSVYVNDSLISTAEGASKKQAEEASAKKALEKLQ